MEDIKTKLLETKKDGDKYFLYFAIIFLFILFVIIIPLKHPSDKTVEEAISSVNTQISFIKSNVTNIEHQKDTVFSEEQLNKLDEKILELEAKKTSLFKERISLIQMVDKSVTIPILEVSISQSTVVATFMGFILAGLSLILHCRNKFFAYYCLLSEEERKGIEIPFWTAPIPLTTKNLSFQEWAVKNTLGLLVHIVVVYVGMDTIRTIKRIDSETNAVNIIIYITAIAIYLTTIIQFIKQECKRITR